MCIRDRTGSEGVIIPRRNVSDLMLDREVVAAVAAGKFHIYPVESVDEGISILTGVRAGKRLASGRYQAGTVHALVEDALREMAVRWKGFAKEEGVGKKIGA